MVHGERTPGDAVADSRQRALTGLEKGMVATGATESSGSSALGSMEDSKRREVACARVGVEKMRLSMAPAEKPRLLGLPGLGGLAGCGSWERVSRPAGVESSCGSSSSVGSSGVSRPGVVEKTRLSMAPAEKPRLLGCSSVDRMSAGEADGVAGDAPAA